MPNISKLSGVAAADIAAIDSTAKANIAGVSGLTMPSATTAYVSSGLEWHINSQDSNSYSGAGATTWVDLTGTQNMDLNNGPTKPSGQDYVAFDGVDDYADVDWISTDYFYGSTSKYTMWTTASMQCVVSFPEEGSTGFTYGDAVLRFGSRNQSTTRGFNFDVRRNGVGVNIFYGTYMRIDWPNTSDFQYNSTRSAYEVIPGKTYSIAITMDRSSSSGHFNAYLNGNHWTPSGTSGSLTQLNSISRWNSTYINNSNVRRGRVPWYFCIGQSSSGAVSSNALPANVYEYMLYTSELTEAEVEQNQQAYEDRYGAI